MPTNTSDHWLNIVLGIGAIFGVLAVIIGAIFTARYGRRASLTLEATVHKMPTGFVVAARPSVRAVGVFRVRFLGGVEGSQVEVTELYTDTAGGLHEARTYPRRNLFGEALVDGGEELTTTTLIPVPIPPGSVVGWAVWVEVRAPNRFLGRKWVRGLGRWVARRRPMPWLRSKLPGPVRQYLRHVFGDWSWTDQIFVPRPPEKAQPPTNMEADEPNGSMGEASDGRGQTATAVSAT